MEIGLPTRKMPPLAIVTLTTDFGTRDGYVGAMKGVVLSRAPDAQIVDITHEIPRHDVAAGAYALATALPLFRRGTIHVAVVDPGVGGDRREVICAVGGQFVVAPDNGLLDLLALGPMQAYAIENDEFRRSSVSMTFHGRDVFAAAAGALATGLPPAKAGPEVTLGGHLEGDLLSPSIVHVDVFGNLISNLRCEPFAGGAGVVIIAGREVPVGRTYGDVEIGALVAYCGSANTVEIAAREGSAAEVLGVSLGESIELKASS